MKNNRQPVFVFLSRLWPLKRDALAQRGFTLVEVMMAFSIIVIVLVGLTSALTASMRLNTVQKQRALAQDVVRDVMSTYVKNEPYADINPFTDNHATYASDPFSITLYDGASHVNNLDSYSSLPAYLASDLNSLHDANLQLLISPIKRTATQYYESKINVLARLSWNGGERVVEMPAVVGQGDLTRTVRARFEEPQPTPSPVTQIQCTPENGTPSAGAPCCPGFMDVANICVEDVSNLVCAILDQDPNGPGKDGTCCTGFVEDNGVCIAEIPSGPTCGAQGQQPVLGACCTGLNLQGSSGTCENCQPGGTVWTGGGNPPAGWCCNGYSNDMGTRTCNS